MLQSTLSWQLKDLMYSFLKNEISIYWPQTSKSSDELDYLLSLFFLKKRIYFFSFVAVMTNRISDLFLFRKFNFFILLIPGTLHIS